jgi:glyoxylase-like metal-dependent hydrolase (beta-lactamase superfamily II)
MPAIRKQGMINENTMLLDTGMYGLYGLTAVYLVQGTRKCLIDTGARANTAHLVEMLRELDAFPPDLVILTHPHWDHMQGLPLLKREAARQGRQIEALAGKEAIPLLAEPSFNDVFGHGPHESIQDVTPVSEGDSIDLGGLTLHIYEAVGHCPGGIAILDEKNRNIFVGDAIGDKFGDHLFLPAFMPPFWNGEAFLASINKLKEISFESLCLAHFGCIYGSEAVTILDEAVGIYQLWWNFFEMHAERLSDNDYLVRAMREEINPELIEIRPTSLSMKALVRLITSLGSLLGRKTAIIDQQFLSEPIRWLAVSYKMSASAG